MELKPCPFCGHSATLRDFECRYPLKKPEVFYYIECFGCGARTELCVDAIIAVAKWNRRCERAVD